MANINLKEGMKKSICTCGKSKTLPYCDDTHREINEKEDTNYKSLKITSDKDVELTISSSTWDKV